MFDKSNIFNKESKQFRILLLQYSAICILHFYSLESDPMSRKFSICSNVWEHSTSFFVVNVFFSFISFNLVSVNVKNV
jgi:hypothetical protein